MPPATVHLTIFTVLTIFTRRPPSPPPQRAYRTPIAMQTRIGGGMSSGSGLGLLPGLATVQRGGGALATSNNVVASLLSDLGILGGNATITSTSTLAGARPQSVESAMASALLAAGSQNAAASRQGQARGSSAAGMNPGMDIHIAILQSPGANGYDHHAPSICSKLLGSVP